MSQTRGRTSGRGVTLSDFNPDYVERLRRRFVKKTKRLPNGCVYWMGYYKDEGYGELGIVDPVRGNTIYMAHRAAWLLEAGELRPNHIIVQTCGNHRCVNPKHLVERVAAGAREFSKQELRRVRRIRERYVAGASIERLAVDYRMSIDSMRDICGNRSYHDEAYNAPPLPMPTGENHYSAKLTAEKVLEYRKRWDRRPRGQKAGPNSAYQLAKEAGVAYSTMWYALTGVTWRDL